MELAGEAPQSHRVQKLLSNYGFCSRRKAEQLIEDGRVKVNGKIIAVGDKASESDKISVDGKLVSGDEKIYLMFNKPTGCVTALTDQRLKTVMDYIRVSERVFPIGRLDYNTSGLLLMTNDGDFANNVMHPRYEVTKGYVATLDKPITQDAIRHLEKGIPLEDGLTSPAKANAVKGNRVSITIHEGKNRIVRRMMEALGYEVKALKRTHVGKLELGTLPPGGYRELKQSEISKIFE